MATGSAAQFPLDAADLANGLRSGIHRVIQQQETLNRINVFPVADGDTGTNLCMSLGAALNSVRYPGRQDVGDFLAHLADVLLDGARGNSGAIVAQFFQGVSDSAGELKSFSARNLADAITNGSRYAHDALSSPQEGTILSVIAVFANRFRDHVQAEPDSSPGASMNRAMRAAHAALAQTQFQLDVLRRAGVVDAGAQGFVALMDGMTEYFVNGTVAAEPEVAATLIEATPGETAGAEADLEFRYCTECIVTGSNIDRRKLREQLSELGDSLVLAGTKRKAKIHIHVNEPDLVFELARRHGDPSSMKADDMQRQQASTYERDSRFAVITDSAADIPDEDMERLDIHMVPCRIQFGDRGYLDKVSISTDEFFATLASSPDLPTTSQPAPGDFRRQFQHLASHFDDVVSVNLTPRVSGTLQAAESAASRTDASGRIHVVNSQNASVGQGQLAVYAAECADAGLDVETTLNALRQMVPRTSSFALIRDLQYAVRGGRVPASRKWIADWLHLTPVLRTTADGRVATSGVLPGRKNVLPAFARFVAKHSNSSTELRVTVGHAVCEDDALALQSLLEELLPHVLRSTITQLGSALGAHGGPGSLVVSVQEFLDPESLR